MEKPNIKIKQNLNIEVNASCPNCDTGQLIPFLKVVPDRLGSYGSSECHYEIYYRCSRYPKCKTEIEG
jgi:hypothetical protein